MKEKWFQLYPGVLFCLLLGIPAWWLGTQVPVVGGAVFGIVLGMLAAAIKVVPAKAEPGTKWISKKGLQCAVVLLGFEMNVRNVVETGISSFILILCTLATAFLAAFLMQRLLKLDGKTATLIGVGTAICGGSAIAATAPVIDADEKQMAYSVSTIFLFNAMAVFLFPLVGHLLGLSDVSFGYWAGTAINDTSSVVAAGYAYSDAAGDLATIVKITRTLMIIPICFVLSIYQAQKSRAAKEPLSLKKMFPLFILFFLIASAIRTTEILPLALTGFLGKTGKFIIILAITAIGLNTDLKALLSNGKKPILLGMTCWVCVACVSLLAQKLMGII